MAFWTPVSDDGRPVFERILEPLGWRVWNAVSKDLVGDLSLINPSDVVQDTVLRCSAILADPIYSRFSSLRAAHSRISSSFRFDAFETDFIDRGLVTLLERRPALQRLLERVLANTAGAWAEIARSIARDRPSLARNGLIQSSAEAVECVSPGASDFHDGGRSASRVQFSASESLYLKPRSGSADMVWNEMLSDVGTILGVDLPISKVVDRKSHYWTRAVRASKERDSLEHYYTQLGVVTFLIFLLQGIDFHCENLIASKHGPVVVDLEGLLHPTERIPTSLDPATAEAFSRLVTSVVNTGLLPCSIEGDERSASVGAMNPPIEARSRRVVAVDPRTNQMRFEWRDFSDSWTAHTPLQPHEHFEDEWVRAVVNGFQLAYRACQAGGLNRTIRRSIAAFSDSELRFIARPTAYYYNALHELLTATYDAEEVDEHAVLSRYLRSLPDCGVDDRFVELEVEALAQFDIPRFTRSGGDLRVELLGAGAAQLDRPFNPIKSSSERLRRLSITDRHLQESLLSASFGGLQKARPLERESIELLSDSEIIDVAVSCGRSILATSIRSNREIAWLMANPVSSTRTSITVCGIDIYSGLCGIAVFLGELYRATGDPDFKRGAIQCIDTIKCRLKHERSRLGLGGGTGIGGILYGLASLSASVPDSCAQDMAALLCDELSRELILADKSFDIIDGSAGLLLGLNALRPVQRYEDFEEACVEALLLGLVDAQKQGLSAWQTFEKDRAHSGMAHGSSGIAMALARHYSTSRSAEVFRAIQVGLAFDQSVDLARNGMPNQWCHGAPGIALAHWAIRQSMPVETTPQRQALINRARSWTFSAPDSDTDGLCCGLVGRAAVLFHTETHGPVDASWRSLVSAACKGRDRNTTFRWSAGNDGLNPGLFVGLGGIGLELLHMGIGQKGLSPLLFT